jgi:hypothetical protein
MTRAAAGWNAQGPAGSRSEATQQSHGGLEVGLEGHGLTEVIQGNRAIAAGAQ